VQGPALRSTEGPPPLRAVHTPNFPALLVTTYQAGKLVLVRDEGDHLNTHFPVFLAPMGMAWTATGWPSVSPSRFGSLSTSLPSPTGSSRLAGTISVVLRLPYPAYWVTLTPNISPDLPQYPLLASGTIGLICYRGPPASG
jgi:hypothetical protein